MILFAQRDNSWELRPFNLVRGTIILHTARIGMSMCGTCAVEYDENMFFSFEVRSQCFSLAFTCDQHNRLMSQKFSTIFLVKASSLLRPRFVVSHVSVNHMCFFVRYDSGVELSRMTLAVHNSPFQIFTRNGDK